MRVVVCRSVLVIAALTMAACGSSVTMTTGPTATPTGPRECGVIVTDSGPLSQGRYPVSANASAAMTCFEGAYAACRGARLTLDLAETDSGEENVIVLSPNRSNGVCAERVTETSSGTGMAHESPVVTYHCLTIGGDAAALSISGCDPSGVGQPSFDLTLVVTPN